MNPNGATESVTVLLEAIVITQYGQFELVWQRDGLAFGGDYGEVFAGQVNGLVGASSPSGVYVNLASVNRGSAVRIELLEVEPHLDEKSWEDIVEVSVEVPAGAVPHTACWGHESTARVKLPPGCYRLRASERGRDEAHAFPDHPAGTDVYLLQLWPAAPRPDAVLKVSSENAKYWQAENGGLRWPARS